MGRTSHGKDVTDSPVSEPWTTVQAVQSGTENPHLLLLPTDMGRTLGAFSLLKEKCRVWPLPVLWVDMLLTELNGQEMSSEPSQAEPQPLTSRFSHLLGHWELN